MGKKAKLKAIKRLAMNMPAINENSHEKHYMQGKEILEWGTVKEIDGQPIDPEKFYWFNYPVMMIQNNGRRMKKAYLKHGEKGITHLLNHTLNVAKSNLNQ